MTGVVWIHRYDWLASYRYRCAIPSEEIAKLNGFKVGINDGDADIAVFSKPIEKDVEIAKHLKAEGAKIVVDIADDHFAKSHGDAYRKMADVADALICASDVMRARIGEEIGREACVIGDPYEFEEREPHANGDSLLWFGHQRNFTELLGVMPQMGDRKLRIVTGPKPIPQAIPWSMENMQKAFDLSNIVLLPTMEGHEYKSPNRLVNSLRQGLFAVCQMHPAYFAFRDYVWVGHFHTGLRWTEAFVSELNDRVKEGQEYIRERYSPETIGKQWASFLGSL